MTEVVFITGLADVMPYATRLIRKKRREGERVAVFGPDQDLARLDTLLWTEEEREFLPHLRWRGSAPPSEVQRQWTPLWLLSEPVAGLDCSTAVNLGYPHAEAFREFARVAELVPDEAGALKAARVRWRQYGEWGCPVVHHPQAPD